MEYASSVRHRGAGAWRVDAVKQDTNLAQLAGVAVREYLARGKGGAK